jgi:diguanylate cyclase (GGDEF)-like protein/PAS domain S-box-containing protein
MKEAQIPEGILRQLDSLREREEYFRVAFESNPDAMSIHSLEDGVCLGMSDGFLGLTGRTRDEVVGKRLEELPLWHDRKFPAVMMKALREGGAIDERETAVLHRDATTRSVLVSAAVMGGGNKPFFLCVLRDITEKKMAEEAMWEAIITSEDERAKSRAILAAIESGVCIKDRECKYVYQNRMHEDMFGHLVGKFCSEKPGTSDGRCGECPLEKSFRDGKIHKVEMSMTAGDGTMHYELTSSPIRSSAGNIIGGIEVAHDITERKLMEEGLRTFAERDFLTGLFNRRMLFNFLDIELQRAKRYGRPVSLLMIDIDEFKRVNDRFGHDTGDRVLKAMAKIIGSTIRESDVFARYGGEEFVILSPETSLSGAKILAEKIRETLESHSFDEAGTVTLSIGVTSYHDSDTADTLIKRADDALYLGKQQGRNRSIICP